MTVVIPTERYERSCESISGRNLFRVYSHGAPRFQFRVHRMSLSGLRTDARVGT